MDSNGEGVKGVSTPVKSNSTEGDGDYLKSNNKVEPLASKLMSVGSFRDKKQLLRADTIDLKMLDIQLERMNYSRSWSLDSDFRKKKEAWEIDLSKLDIRYVIAQGTYGIVYRGVYDGQDVAGTNIVLPVTIVTDENLSLCLVKF